MGVRGGTRYRTTGHLPPPSEPASDPQLPRLWGLSVPTQHWRFCKAMLSAERESCYHEHRQDLETRFLTLLGSYRRALPKGRLTSGQLNPPNPPHPDTKHQTAAHDPSVLPDKVRACTHLQTASGSPQNPRAAGRASRGGQRQGSMRPLRLHWATGQQLWATERARASTRPRLIVRPSRPRRGLCEEPTPT